MPPDAYVDLGAVGFDLTRLHTGREGVDAILMFVAVGHEASFRVERSERRHVAVCARFSGIAPVVALVDPRLTVSTRDLAMRPDTRANRSEPMRRVELNRRVGSHWFAPVFARGGVERTGLS